MRHPVSMSQSTRTLRFVLIPIGFALAGAASRWVFQLTETRLQISIFVILAACIEIFADDLGSRPSVTRFLVNALAVSSAIIAVRLHLEGPPHKLVEWLAQQKR